MFDYGLGCEGPFRIPGPSERVAELSRMLDTDGGWADMHLQPSEDPYALCDLLKRYIKSLPVPVITGKQLSLPLKERKEGLGTHTHPQTHPRTHTHIYIHINNHSRSHMIHF